MRGERALSWALALSFVTALAPAAARADQRDLCTVAVHDLKLQIEGMKQIKAHPERAAVKTGKKTKEVPPESIQAILARERQHTDALNGIVRGMGCSPVDIDQELAKPSDPALAAELATSSPSAKPKRHHKLF
jgi:hypothetical protein